MALASMYIEPPLVKEVRQYAGLLADIPAGWALCDGASGRPDLRSKFIKGTAAAENPGGTGGSATHTHPDHPALSHSGGAVGSIAATAAAAVKIGTSGATGAANTHTHPAPSFTPPDQHAAQSHTAANSEPAYYKLAYITKPEWWP